jgi:F0F1-type ATP synthase membrane subunit c/vacuolar-type H+-ATPase subunit K
MQRETLPPQVLRTMRILWAAIFGSTLALIAVLQQVHVTAQPANPMMPIVFAIVALGCIGVGVMLPLTTLRAARAQNRLRPAMYQTAAILGLALTESVALFGFVLAFLGFSPASYMPFFGVAWIIFVLRFPQSTRPLGFFGPTM